MAAKGVIPLGKSAISRKAWQRAVNALLWYPDNIEEYNLLEEELTSSNGGNDNPNSGSQGGGSIVKDPTGTMGVRLAENKRRQTLEQEIEAVMKVTTLIELPDGTRPWMKPEQREVIRQRYWQHEKWNPGGRRKPRPYEFLQDLGYSVEAMKWINKQTILRLATYLGEK